MIDSLAAYLHAVSKHTRALLSGAIAGAFGIAVTIHPFLVPSWLWFGAVGATVVVVQFLAFHELREELSVTRDVARIARTLGTELRDIRHKIDLARSTRPTPHYSHEFALPDQRWGETAQALAARPDLYAVVERAYVAAHHVNDVMRLRRTRAAPHVTLGIRSDDGLDDAYEAAGAALDALGEPRGDTYETPGQRAVRGVVEDLLDDSSRVTPPPE